MRVVREERAPAGSTMSGAVRFAVRSLVVVTLGYAVLSIYLYTHVDATRDWLRRVPPVVMQLCGPRVAVAGWWRGRCQCRRARRGRVHRRRIAGGTG